MIALSDRIERSVELAHPPDKVWAALTTAESLSSWFSEKATIDLRPGGAAVPGGIGPRLGHRLGALKDHLYRSAPVLTTTNAKPE